MDGDLDGTAERAAQRAAQLAGAGAHGVRGAGGDADGARPAVDPQVEPAERRRGVAQHDAPVAAGGDRRGAAVAERQDVRADLGRRGVDDGRLELQLELVARGVEDLEAQRLALGHRLGELGDERDAREDEQAVGAVALRHAAGERQPRAERDVGELGAQDERVDGDDVHVRGSRPLNRALQRPTTEDDMDRALYIAASGMLAELQRQNQLANDLANTATPGYKADRSTLTSFGSVLLQNTKDGSTIGALDQGVQVGEVVTDFRPQALRDTGEPLDFAVAGEGFFAVQTDQGVRFTRNGAFAAASNGTLVDQLGNPVLDANRRPVRVGDDGTVRPEALGTFMLRAPRKAGEGLYEGTATGPGTGEVQARKLEASGIDEAATTIQMMASMRAFEASQKAITTIDDTLKAAAGQIGSIRV